MKRIKALLLIAIIAIQANGQSLIDAYKSGTLTLTPVTAYAEGVNWNNVFPDYNAVSYGNPIGRYKSIAVAPDGSVFVGNYSSYTIQKFDSNGKLVTTFGTKGNKESDFKQRPTLGGVVGGKYVFTHEHNGHIKLFSLNGDFVKNIVLDYMPLKAIALENNRIAVLGHVSMGTKVRYVVTIIDPETGTTNIIKRFDNIFDRNKSLTVQKDGYITSCSPMMSKVSVLIKAMPNGNILIAVNDSKRIEIYSPSGSLVKQFELDFENLPYPTDLKVEFTSRMENMAVEKKFTKNDIAPIYEKDFFPSKMPFFYNILIDSDGNILVFKFVNEDVDHKFSVYTFDGDGKSIAETKLEVPNYTLSLNDRFDELVFHKGFIIGLLVPSTSQPSTAKLVKLKY